MIECRSESGYSSIEIDETHQTIPKHESTLEPNSLEAKEKHSISKEEEERLRRENLRLKDERLCKICADKELGVVYIPCGHFVTCTNCAATVSKCPVCRGHITNLVKTYLS